MSTDKNILKDINNSLQWHCEANFTKDYHKTVKALVNKLKKNKEFSMDGGKYLGWVGGLLYVVGEDSNLFDPNNVKCDKLYYSKSEVAEGVGISATTMRARANDIREALPEGSKFEAEITYVYNDNFESHLGKSINHMNFSDIEKYQIYMEKAMNSQSYEETINYLQKAVDEAQKNDDMNAYFNLRNDLAYVYFVNYDYDKAINEYEDLLKYDEDDKLQVRFNLSNLLLLNKRYEEFEKLMKDSDKDTFMAYTKALYYFAKEDMENASKFIKMAFDANIHVPKYLLDLEIIEEIPSKYEVGDEGEAMNYYEMTSNTWISVDKSLYWILDEYFDYMKKNKIKTDFKKKDVKKEVDAIYEMING